MVEISAKPLREDLLRLLYRTRLSSARYGRIAYSRAEFISMFRRENSVTNKMPIKKARNAREESCRMNKDLMTLTTDKHLSLSRQQYTSEIYS